MTDTAATSPDATTPVNPKPTTTNASGEGIQMATVTSLADEGFRQIIVAGAHTLFSDLPTEKGGENTAADPHQLFYAAWGACTNMTVQLYCRKKHWPLQSVTTHFQEEKQGSKVVVHKRIDIQGPLDDAQLERIKQIAEKCPVNQLIVGQKEIVSAMRHVDPN